MDNNNNKHKIKDKIYIDTKHKLHQNDLVFQIFQHKNSIAELESIKQKQSSIFVELDDRYFKVMEAISEAQRQLTNSVFFLTLELQENEIKREYDYNLEVREVAQQLKKEIINKDRYVYDLSIQDNHNYIISSKNKNNKNGIIVHNCHKASAESYFKVNQWLKNTRWTLGLTATPFRDDGKDMLINAVCGYPCFTKSSEELIKEGYLVKPTVTFINNFDNTDYKKKELIINDYFRELCNHDKIVMEKKKAELYRSYYKTFIVKNEARNNKIQELVEENSDKKILIMVKSVEHGQMLSGQLKVPYISGKLNKKERSQHFDDFKGEKLNILIGTFSIFSEGIDIPAIDMVINAGANSGSVKTIQMIGRALRAKVGKNNAVYYDFKDPYKFLNFASVKRQKALKKEGYMITIQNRI